MDEDPGYALAAAVLSELEPSELPALPGVWRAYWRQPVRPDELRGRDRLVGAGLGDQVIAWAPVVVAFIATEVLRAAALDEAKDAVRSGVKGVVGRIRRRKPDPRPDPALPLAFSEDEIREVRRRAMETALAIGEEPARATLFANAVAGGLTRLAAPPAERD